MSTGWRRRSANASRGTGVRSRFAGNGRRAFALEREVRLDLDRLSLDLEHWMSEEIDRARRGAGIDDEIAAAAQFDANRGVMAEVVRLEGRSGFR